MASRNHVDRALETAREILEVTVCECGDLESDHAFKSTESTAVHRCGHQGCRCRDFRPVTFHVTRAPQQPATPALARRK